MVEGQRGCTVSGARHEELNERVFFVPPAFSNVTGLRGVRRGIQGPAVGVY